MKMLAPFVYLFYFIRGIFTSPLYAWRRTKALYGRMYQNPSRHLPPPKRPKYQGPQFISENGVEQPADPPHKRRRRGHRGGRKHKKHHN